MSKTDKTRPFWVKVADHPSLLEESHEHDDGLPCDLPPKPVFRGWGDRTTRCQWTPSTLAMTTPEVTFCGCRMCSMQDWRKRENRQDRYRGRRYASRRWMDEYGE